MIGKTIRLPKPHNGQLAVLQSNKRFKWVSAGRRWRKTTLAMIIAVNRALAKETIIWGAPTYDQCRVGWDELVYAAGDVATFNQTRMEAHFPGGGRILFRTLDNPSHKRGHGANGIIIDEASYIPESAYYEVLQPMIADTEGWGVYIFTPNGHNWTWRESIAALDREDSAFWQIPTLGVQVVNGQLVRKPHPLENPSFPFTEAQRLYETLPERVFKAEFMAEFLEGSGAVFRRIDEAATLEMQVNPIAGHEYVMGCDWAMSNDFTAIAVLDLTTKQMVALDRFNGIDWSLQRGRLKALYDHWKPRVVVAEENSIGSPNIEALVREGVRIRSFKTTAQSKPPLIESLVLAFERLELHILDNPILKAELTAYERRVSPATGRSQYTAPEGMHDDTVIALALAWSEAAHGLHLYELEAWGEDKLGYGELSPDLKAAMIESGIVLK